MSDIDEDQVRSIVRDEVSRFIKWLVGLFGLPLIALAVSAVVLWTQHTTHINDGHPARVEKMVATEHEAVEKLKTELEVWREAGLPFILIEIRSELQHLRTDMDELKKKLSN